MEVVGHPYMQNKLKRCESSCNRESNIKNANSVKVQSHVNDNFMHKQKKEKKECQSPC